MTVEKEEQAASGADSTATSSPAEALGSVPASHGRGGMMRFVKGLLGLFAGAFVLHTAFSLASKWDSTDLQFRPHYLILGTVVSAGAMLLQLAAFRALLKGWTGVELPKRASARVYLDSQMARYTPGKVGLLAVRIASARDLGVSGRVMGAALLVEVLSWACAGCIVGGGFAGWFAVDSLTGPFTLSEVGFSSLAVAAAFGSGVVMLALIALDRRFFPSLLIRLVSAPGRGPLVPALVPALQVLNFLALALCGALMARGVGVGWESSFAVGGLFCTAIVLGFLALFAPAGAGIREAVFIAGATPLVGAKLALSVGLLARGASLLSDVLLFLWFRYRDQSRADSAS